MTTKQQIKDLVRPLLERNSDLTIIGRDTLWLRPVGSVGRLVLIDRTSRAECCRVSWYLSEFFMPSAYSWDRLGRCNDLISRSAGFEGGQGWYWSDPTIYTDIVTRVEADALATLRPLRTARACLEFARTRRATIGYLDAHWHLFAHIALGELDAARAMWAKSRGFYRPGRIMDEPIHQLEYDRFCLIDVPLMADDRAGLAVLLHRWEAENIVGSPLEPHWVKELLPLEEE
ncbi:hypothetical protein [Methylobacterium sp. J-090]|uniref:hypothetical protein n=1 Tax=Methylobacterium sp. J-090 TaxID=2836666 RepID=UPI001FB896AE|nr:hypothetical protein [Methylobacterium sp. J-090]MCJ2082868.1 hypothetical protein [Methylobacterium sp. J-090]